jgi:hypothetical protein
MTEKQSLSRRHMVGGAGIGLVGIATSAASAIAKGGDEMAVQEMQDPTTKYPKPPYPR